MAELKFDWSACIVSGGAELINRVEAARGEYSGVCSEYFDYLVSKAGKTGVHCLATGADASVGADIQHARESGAERIEELAKTFMEPRELHSLQICSGAEKADMFYREWTRRESYYKRCGQDDFPMSGIFREGIIRACGGVYYYSISLPENDD